MDAVRYWELFDRDFPMAVQEEFLRGLMATYPAAWEGVSTFSDRTGTWLQPYLRHALVRDTMIAIADRHQYLEAGVQQTEPPTTDYLTLASGSTIVTVAHVDSPNEVPRWARHRESLAGGENLSLFPDPTEGRRPLYAVLLFGPEVSCGPVQHVPAFLNIGIPVSDYGSYVGGVTRPLFDAFPEAVEDVLGIRPADIRDAVLQARRRVVEKGWAG